MRRNSRLLSAASGLAVALSLSAPALADAICPPSANGACITGNNLPQEIFASAVGADNIEVVSPGFSWTPAVYRSNSGTATFGAMDFIAGPVMTNDPAPDVSTYPPPPPPPPPPPTTPPPGINNPPHPPPYSRGNKPT